MPEHRENGPSWPGRGSDKPESGSPSFSNSEEPRQSSEASERNESSISTPALLANLSEKEGAPQLRQPEHALESPVQWKVAVEKAKADGSNLETNHERKAWVEQQLSAEEGRKEYIDVIRENRKRASETMSGRPETVTEKIAAHNMELYEESEKLLNRLQREPVSLKDIVAEASSDPRALKAVKLLGMSLLDPYHPNTKEQWDNLDRDDKKIIRLGEMISLEVERRQAELALDDNQLTPERAERYSKAFAVFRDSDDIPDSVKFDLEMVQRRLAEAFPQLAPREQPVEVPKVQVDQPEQSPDRREPPATVKELGELSDKPTRWKVLVELPDPTPAFEAMAELSPEELRDRIDTIRRTQEAYQEGVSPLQRPIVEKVNQTVENLREGNDDYLPVEYREYLGELLDKSGMRSDRAAELRRRRMLGILGHQIGYEMDQEPGFLNQMSAWFEDRWARVKVSGFWRGMFSGTSRQELLQARHDVARSMQFAARAIQAKGRLSQRELFTVALLNRLSGVYEVINLKDVYQGKTSWRGRKREQQRKMQDEKRLAQEKQAKKERKERKREGKQEKRERKAKKYEMKEKVLKGKAAALEAREKVRALEGKRQEAPEERDKNDERAQEYRRKTEELKAEAEMLKMEDEVRQLRAKGKRRNRLDDLE